MHRLDRVAGIPTHALTQERMISEDDRDTERGETREQRDRAAGHCPLLRASAKFSCNQGAAASHFDTEPLATGPAYGHPPRIRHIVKRRGRTR